MAKLKSLKPTRPNVKSLTVTLLLSSALLSGCSYLEPYKAPLVQGNVMTAESVDLLQEGLTKNQVRELLGPPMGQHPFNPNQWEYTYFSSEKNDKTAKLSRYLTIEFDNDQLLANWSEKENEVALKQDDSWLGLDWF